MRACIQRVSRAQVTVDRQVIGRIGRGLVVLLGVGSDDSDDDAQYLADKIAGLRIFDDSEGKMNLAIRDVGGAMLVISQFTLYGDCRRGRRPSFTDAAPPDRAMELYEAFVRQLEQSGVPVQLGRFREHMDVELVNDGPVTLLVDSDKAF
jgi:D-tyrosyl-tRNA(Tyr) deacylase